MSIQTQIDRLETEIADSYSACNAMGAAMPDEKVIANLPNTIRSIPQEGGGSVEEIYYVNGTLNMSTLTFTTTMTFDEIAETISNEKYVVARAVTSDEMVVYLPITSIDTDSAVFNGLMMANLNHLGYGTVIVAVTVVIQADGIQATHVRVVNTTTLG